MFKLSSVPPELLRHSFHRNNLYGDIHITWSLSTSSFGQTPMKRQHVKKLLFPFPRNLQLPTITLFRAAYTHEYAPSYAALPLLDDPDHVLHARTLARYHDRPRDTLWLSCTSNLMQRKKVVRSWCRRRLEQALREALTDLGFGWDGKVKNGGAGGEGLSGTLHVLAKDALACAKWGEVKEEAGVLVEKIRKMCERKSRIRN